jgi:hypothetical protein
MPQLIDLEIVRLAGINGQPSSTLLLVRYQIQVVKTRKNRMHARTHHGAIDIN